MASIEATNVGEPNLKENNEDTAGDTTIADPTTATAAADVDADADAAASSTMNNVNEEESTTISIKTEQTTEQDANCDNNNTNNTNNTSSSNNNNNNNNINNIIKTENDEDDNKGNNNEQQVDDGNNASDAITIKNDEDVAMASNDNNNTETTEETNENKTNLIVNYLPQQMTDEEFEELFKKFGKMKSCKIVRNRASGYSYGFGFVDFETHEQAIQAIEELNGHELETKKIKVAFARPAGQDIKQANLYIKNIPADWTQEQVRKHFEPYGNIIQVRVLSNNRGVAFVLYDLRKQAEDALEALNGKTIEGSSNPLEIKFAADKKSEKTNKSAKGGKSGDNSNDNASASEGGGGNAGATGTVRKRERGHRGGRNHRLRMERRNQRAAAAASANNDSSGAVNKPSGQSGGGSFFDRRQNDNRQRNQGRFIRNNYNNNNNTSSSNNTPIYGGGVGAGVQYGGVPYNNQLNGIGPMRQMQVNKMNRYTPFVPLQPMMGTPAQAVVAPNQSTGAPIAGAQPITQNPTAMAAYGYPTQQSMIPYAHMMSAAQSQMATGNQMHQMTSQAAAAATGQMAQTAPLATMYTAATSQVAHHPMAHYIMQASQAPQAAAINNIYSVASNNMTNAANMQPQLGQPMNQHMRSGGSGSGGGGGGGLGGGSDDGITLFVYNIGPDSDESELRSMFCPYGQVVKCNVVRKTPGGETKGFGFVTMKDRDQANGAIAGLNGSMRNGRALQVSLKK